MTPRERAFAAIRGETPDTVPIQMDSFLFCARLTGKPYGDVFRDPRLLAESQLRAQELVGLDIIDMETGVAALAEACGCAVEYPADAAPWVTRPVFREASGPEILRRLASARPPEPAGSPSLAVMIEAVRILARKTGADVLLKAEADQGPFSLAAGLVGMDRFLEDLADGGEHVIALLDFAAEACSAYASALREAGAEVIVMGDSFAGPDVVSPKTYAQLAFPREKKVISRAHSCGALYSLHICGNVDSIIAKVVETGADIIEIDEKTDLASASRAAAGKACLLGAVSPRILRNGSPGEVEEETARVMRSMKGNPRFILSPGCSLAGDTPVENVRAFVRAGRELGARAV